jgi:hypothetical protein
MLRRLNVAGGLTLVRLAQKLNKTAAARGRRDCEGDSANHSIKLNLAGRAGAGRISLSPTPNFVRLTPC